MLVENVPRGTPAYAGGVNAGDEILAIDDFRVLPDDLDARLAAYRPGRKVVLLVSRRDELKRLDVTLGAVPADRWTLQARPGRDAVTARAPDEVDVAARPSLLLPLRGGARLRRRPARARCSPSR